MNQPIRFNMYALLLMLLISVSSVTIPNDAQGQKVEWKNVSMNYGVLTTSIQVFESTSTTLNDSAFRAFYVVINTKDPAIKIGVDTTLFRRLTPQSFYERLSKPTIVMNASFFEFKNNTNLNVLVHQGHLLALNKHDIEGKRKDSLTYTHVLSSAIGMNKRGKLDVAYSYTDSNKNYVLFQQNPISPIKDTIPGLAISNKALSGLKKWKLKWAVGGGPVLLKDSAIYITNNEEKKFAGKAINDHHPRTAMGYTKEGQLILLAVQGRMKNMAVGTTLTETAQILLELGCIEAINLDGGGSSCLLLNGKETIKPSDPTGQRPLPAVLYVE